MVVGAYRLAMSHVNASCYSLHAVHSSALDVPCIQMAGNVCIRLESASEFPRANALERWMLAAARKQAAS